MILEIGLFMSIMAVGYAISGCVILPGADKLYRERNELKGDLQAEEIKSEGWYQSYQEVIGERDGHQTKIDSLTAASIILQSDLEESRKAHKDDLAKLEMLIQGRDRFKEICEEQIVALREKLSVFQEAARRGLL